jgi:hypothetical protein
MGTEEVIVYKGDKNISLTTKSTIVDHPDAEIGKRARPEDVSEYTYWPITCLARGLNPKFAPFDIDQYEPTGKTQVIDGQKCVELVYTSRANNSRRFLLIDPGRGFLLIRYYIVTDDRVTTRLDVKYAPDPKLNWVPKSWDYTASTPIGGWRLGSKQITLEACDVNIDLTADTFELRLPSGTRVYDEYDGAAKQYVIRDDGDSGPAMPDASRPTYKQLTALAQEARWTSSDTTIVVIASAVFLLAVLALIWRWRRRAVRGSSPPP